MDYFFKLGFSTALQTFGARYIFVGTVLCTMNVQQHPQLLHTRHHYHTHPPSCDNQNISKYCHICLASYHPQLGTTALKAQKLGSNYGALLAEI